MVRIGPEAAELLRLALVDPQVQGRYAQHISDVLTPTGCQLWTGAVSGRGHGRLWIGTLDSGKDVTVIAHRYGWGLTYGYQVLMETPRLRHDCDNPLCQNMAHIRQGTEADNRNDWTARYGTPGSPLHDRRGPLGRALALRQAARNRSDISQAIDAGLTDLDRYQPALFDDEVEGATGVSSAKEVDDATGR